MFDKTIIGGVDDSQEGAWAAALSWELAKRAEVPCRIIHVASEVSAPAPMLPPEVDFEGLVAHVRAAARKKIEARLSGNVSPDVLPYLDVRTGKPGLVLPEVVSELGAGLVVVGGKKHTAAGRWFGGSTAHDLIGTSSVPVLVAVPPAVSFERVLIAVDLSEATAHTFDRGLAFARFTGAELRIVHAVEPLPYDYAVQIQQPEAHVEWTEKRLADVLAKLPGAADLDRVIRYGRADRVLVEQVREWNADAVVVGSHTLRWVDRMILGSTTRRLLNRLPTSLVIVPARHESE